MERRLIDGSECDPLQLWSAIMKLWNPPRFKRCLRSCKVDQLAESTSDDEEEYTFINWDGNRSNQWNRNGQFSKGVTNTKKRNG